MKGFGLVKGGKVAGGFECPNLFWAVTFFGVYPDAGRAEIHVSAWRDKEARDQGEDPVASRPVYYVSGEEFEALFGGRHNLGDAIQRAALRFVKDNEEPDDLSDFDQDGERIRPRRKFFDGAEEVGPSPAK